MHKHLHKQVQGEDHVVKRLHTPKANGRFGMYELEERMLQQLGRFLSGHLAPAGFMCQGETDMGGQRADGGGEE